MQAGTPVCVVGLVGKPELNGEKGVVLRLHLTDGLPAAPDWRYCVRLAGGAELSLKVVNLTAPRAEAVREDVLTVDGLCYCAAHRAEICGKCGSNHRLENRVAGPRQAGASARPPRPGGAARVGAVGRAHRQSLPRRVFAPRDRRVPRSQWRDIIARGRRALPPPPVALRPRHRPRRHGRRRNPQPPLHVAGRRADGVRLHRRHRHPQNVRWSSRRARPRCFVVLRHRRGGRGGGEDPVRFPASSPAGHALPGHFLRRRRDRAPPPPPRQQRQEPRPGLRRGQVARHTQGLQNLRAAARGPRRRRDEGRPRLREPAVRRDGRQARLRPLQARALLRPRLPKGALERPQGVVPRARRRGGGGDHRRRPQGPDGDGHAWRPACVVHLQRRAALRPRRRGKGRRVLLRPGGAAGAEPPGERQAFPRQGPDPDNPALGRRLCHDGLRPH
mmetsp:Transcript_27789/g.93416  ORF Transcript_27789/g.93416 Transcript_27789/m.93416 type:complete len:445 (+) Transcript_27789:33-1367(+)